LRNNTVAIVNRKLAIAKFTMIHTKVIQF
jgi:hypothetical protein